VTLGRDGLGLIGYSDDHNGNLKVAHCLNVACTAATLATSMGADTSFVTCRWRLVRTACR
jgi:HD superfamily phosphodiesterase